MIVAIHRPFPAEESMPSTNHEPESPARAALCTCTPCICFPPLVRTLVLISALSNYGPMGACSMDILGCRSRDSKRTSACRSYSIQPRQLRPHKMPIPISIHSNEDSRRPTVAHVNGMLRVKRGLWSSKLPLEQEAESRLAKQKYDIIQRNISCVHPSAGVSEKDPRIGRSIIYSSII